ncbi:MAG: hypothetical protein QXZ43_04465 [Candidatus Aenigmatarchaeota archaeon]
MENLNKKVLCFSCENCRALIPVVNTVFDFENTVFKCTKNVFVGKKKHLYIYVCKYYVEDIECGEFAGVN